MGTKSYIVAGRGNADSFESAPHGAGRRMSRGEARRRFTLPDLERRMRGIESRLRPSILDEHPDSYKDIDEVMERSKDLVAIEHVLRQVLNVKGD
jgi:tRNA-splicing ligase RtcB